MNIKILQVENSIENVNNSVISALYNAHINGDISLEVDNNNQKVGLVGSITAPAGYGFLVSTLNGAYPKFHVTVNSEYVAFADPNVENILKTSIGDGTGVSTLVIHNLLDLKDLNLINNSDITDFREGVLFDHNPIATSAGFINGSPNLDIVGIPPNMLRWTSFITYACQPTKIVIANWGNWICPELILNGNLLCSRKHDLCTLNSDNSLSVVTSINLPEGVNFSTNRKMFGGFYNSTILSVNIPTSVTRLYDFLFSDITNLTFTLGSTLSIIGEYCFYLCSSLALDVATLPQTITTIKEYAFYEARNVTGVLNLPNLTTLGTQSLRSTKITSVTNLGSTITSIPSCTFFGCNYLERVVLPSTCIALEDDCFASCPLTSIDVSNVTTFGDQIFNGISTLTIPSIQLSNMVLASIRTFRNCNVTGVLDCPNLTLLGRQCFENCTGITGINSLGNITEIPLSCFYGCTGITSITIPSNIVSIKEHAFSRSGNPITNLQLHSSITNIERGAFAKINYPNSCFYFPNFIGNNYTSDLFSFYYGNGNYMSTIGQLYLPHLTGTYTNGHGSFPYWSGLCETLKAQLVYLKDITDFYPGMFSNSDILAIVINNTTPPTLNNSTDNRLEEGAYNTAIFNVVNNWSGFIYVPDGYVNTYISAWENVLDSTRESSAGSTIRTDIVLKNRIKSISELPTYATEADWIAANRPLGLITAYMN